MNWKFFLKIIGILVIIGAIFVASITIIVHRRVAPYIYETLASAPSAEVALIPGAAVSQNDVLSAVLKDRVDMAIKLYEAGKVSKILVSGDNSTIAHNEVNPVRDYLVNRGIPDPDIFLDHAGFDTYSSMYRARDIFKVQSMVIVTQSFHISRAVYLARELGITAYGLNADNGHYLWRNSARETLADVKAVLNLMMRRQPKYLGDIIPIMGDGRASR